MRFHLARVMDRLDQQSCSSSECSEYERDSSSLDDDGDWSSSVSSSSSSTSSSAATEPSHHPLDPDQVHYLAQECLYRGDIQQAILIYRQLLAKQRRNEHAQRADTLSRLVVLCLAAGGRRFLKKANAYGKEALQLHSDSGRPLQAAVSTMEVGLVQFGAGRLSKALILWRQGMQMACVAMGYDHPHVAVLLNNIGVLHSLTGDYPGSMRALQESVALQRATLRSCLPINAENAIHQLATTMANLAIVLDEGRQQYDRAMGYLQESLSLHESVYTFERDHMEDVIEKYMDQLTSRRNELLRESSITSTQTPRTLQAALMERSSSLFGNSDGIPNKLTTESYDNHDFLLLGPLKNELTPEERVNATVVAWFGKRDVTADGAAAFVSFNASLREASRCKSSFPVDVDADRVVDAELHLSAIHEQVMEHLDHGEVDDALDLFRSALNGHKEKYGELHHLVGTTLHNMGMIYLFSKQYAQAQDAFLESMNVRIAALGSNHPDVGASKTKIGLLQLAKGDLSRACDTFWDVRDSYLESLGYAHPKLAKMMNNIGVVAYCHGDLVEAYRCFEIAHEYHLRRQEDEEEESTVMGVATAHTLSNLGFVCTKMGESVRALEFFELSLKLYQKHLGDDSAPAKEVEANVQHLVTQGTRILWDDKALAGCKPIGSMCFAFS